MQQIMKICNSIIFAWRRWKSSYHHYPTKHPLGYKVTRTHRIFWLTNAYYFWPSSHPSAWLCKFCYQAYRWIFFYYFHTLSSSQTYATMPHDAENFRHVLHRCIAPWQKIPFFGYDQSTVAIHSSHVMRTSPKSSHYFGTYEPSLLLGIIFLHQFARLNFIILQIFIMNIIMFRS